MTQSFTSVRDLTLAGKRGAAASAMLPDAINRIVLPNPAIDVWQARLDLGAAHVMQYAELLSRDEQLRAGRLHFERDRRRFIVARGTLRMLLGNHLDIPPAALEFNYTKYGRPFLVEPAAQVHFSVSHSAERALYAISPDCRLGVDIEHLNRDIDYKSLAKRFFTDAENTALERVPMCSRKRAFLACWTRKEAVVKAIGGGLSLPFSQFEVTVDLDTVPRVLDFTATKHGAVDWVLYSPNADHDYVATVAAYYRK